MLAPSVLAVMADNIPLLLQERPCWVVWRMTYKGGRWTKVPHQPDGRHASSTAPATWIDFGTAVMAYRCKNFDGIGIVLDGRLDTEGLALTGIDIDKVRGDADQEARADEIISRLRPYGAYVEWSPSGNGYRIFCRALPFGTGKTAGGVEMYTSGRYLTVTGHTIGGAG
jgi:putative DNA primase/helicase